MAKNNIPARALGVSISIMRKRRGLSMAALSRRVKVSSSNIGAWEASISSPTWINLVTLCNVLNIKLSEFMLIVEATMKHMENADETVKSTNSSDNAEGKSLGASNN